VSVLEVARKLWRRRVERPRAKASDTDRRYALARAAAEPTGTHAAIRLLELLGLTLQTKMRGCLPEWWRQQERASANPSGDYFDLITGLPILAERVADAAPMVLIPGGCFLMGWAEEDCRWVRHNSALFNIGIDDAGGGSQHRVILSPYYMDVHSVTKAQYYRFRPKGRTRRSLKTHGDHPVSSVTWFDARAYAKWASADLPTEGQWERAARGGRQCRYPWGNELPDSSRLNFEGRCGSTTPVRSFPPNPFGLSDMAGNVYDWCLDWYSHDYYAIAPQRNPPGPKEGETKVLRGASWGRWAPSDAGLCHVAFRHDGKPSESCSYWGFRCVVNVI